MVVISPALHMVATGQRQEMLYGVMLAQIALLELQPITMAPGDTQCLLLILLK